MENTLGISLIFATRYCCYRSTFARIRKFHFVMQFNMSPDARVKDISSAIVLAKRIVKQTDANAIKLKLHAKILI